MNVYRIGCACGWQGSHHRRSNIVRAWVRQRSTFTKEAGFVIWGCPGNPNVSNPTEQAWLSVTAQKNTSPLLHRLWHRETKCDCCDFLKFPSSLFSFTLLRKDPPPEHSTIGVIVEFYKTVSFNGGDGVGVSSLSVLVLSAVRVTTPVIVTVNGTHWNVVVKLFHVMFTD